MRILGGPHQELLAVLRVQLHQGAESLPANLVAGVLGEDPLEVRGGVRVPEREQDAHPGLDVVRREVGRDGLVRFERLPRIGPADRMDLPGAQLHRERRLGGRDELHHVPPCLRGEDLARSQGAPSDAIEAHAPIELVGGMRVRMPVALHVERSGPQPADEAVVRGAVQRAGHILLTLLAAKRRGPRGICARRRGYVISARAEMRRPRSASVAAFLLCLRA